MFDYLFAFGVASRVENPAHAGVMGEPMAVIVGKSPTSSLNPFAAQRFSGYDHYVSHNVYTRCLDIF
jgi:hypothetical protein